MRVETPLVPQQLIENNKAIEKKELITASLKGNNDFEESQAGFHSPLGFRSSYTISSLQAAVNSHAKFLTVAESNIQAARHSAMIPKAILDHFNIK